MNSIVQEMNWQTVLQTLEIRLQGIREVTKRARFSFIVLIVASCAIFIVVWNGHFSWNRRSAFPLDMGHCLDSIKEYNKADLMNCLEVQKQGLLEKEKSTTEQNQKQELQRSIADIEKHLSDPRLGLQNFPSNPVDPKNQNDRSVSLDEINRRNLAGEWLKSTNISIGLLGVVINMNDLDVLGSCTLMIISFWFVFNIRRENRAIVGLLKDVRNITKFDELDDKNLQQDQMLIASMAFQEVAHSMTFVSVAKDSPLSSKHIFPAKTQDKTQESIIDNLVRLAIFLLRVPGMIILLLSPVLVIFVIIYADIWSMTMNTAFDEKFATVGGSMSTYLKEMYQGRRLVSLICLFTTLVIFLITVNLQIKTTDALYVFAERLGVDVEVRVIKTLKEYFLNKLKGLFYSKETEAATESGAPRSK